MFLTTTYTEWALAGAGFVVGISATQAENVQNECIAGAFSIVDSAWNVYYYMDKYMTTEEEVHMAWGITYLVKGFEMAYSIDCSSLESDVNGWLEDGLNWLNIDFTFQSPASLAPLLHFDPIVSIEEDAYNESAEFT
jgi:hypothetical protein